MTFLFRLCVVLLPWVLRRLVLRTVYGYDLHRTAWIGWSWIFPRRLVMGAGARIEHFNVAIHLDRVEMGEQAEIVRSNWITGFPKGDRRHFSHQAGRDPALVMGAHSAITKRHVLDCTDRITLGAFATVGGYSSQFLTHSVDLVQNRQNAAPILIGDHSFVGTAVVVLGGSELPARSVLGAKAMLNRAYAEAGWLYAGVPAKAIKRMPADAEYFRRTTGFVT